MGFDFKSKRPHGAWRCSARMGHGGACVVFRIYEPLTLRVGAGARPEMPVRAAGIVAGSSGSASRVVKCTNRVAT